MQARTVTTDTTGAARSTVRARDAAVPSFAEPHATLATEEGRLALYRFGRGPDVLLVHGWPLHAATFRRVVPLLAERFTLHLVDLPGTGNSIDWSGPIDFRSHARTLRRVADHLGLASYALVAHDSGGVGARLLAADDARVRGLVLSGSEIPGHRPPMVQELVTATRVPGAGLLFRAALRSAAFLQSKKGFAGCFQDPAYVLGDFRKLFVEPIVRSRRVFEGQTRLLAALDFREIDALVEVHARTRAPTLCIWGERDPFFPVDRARAMLPQFGGGADLAVVPGARLFVHEDHPEAFASHAATFLEAALTSR
jgi:pimeloyl-ACP methyl ester carboxylesterase